MKFILATCTSSVLFLSCQQPAATDPAPGPAAGATQTIKPSSTAANPGATPTPASATAESGAGAAVDVIIVNATSDVTGDSSGTYKSGIEGILSAVAKAGGAGVHLALISSRSQGAVLPNANLSNLPPAQLRVLDFQTKSGDALITALVAGCSQQSSNFPDLHQANSGNPMICGTDLTTLAGNTRDSLSHSWLWSIEPMRGALQNFYRAGAPKLYVFIGSADASFLDAQSFLGIANTIGGKVTVVAVAPTGSCAQASASNYTNIASASGGAVYDFCSANWSTYASSIAASLPK